MDWAYLIMPKYEMTLGSYLERQQVTCDDILEFGRQILTHLYVIHSAGYVHNDLKPDNFMINGSNLQIIDFGFASRYRSKDDRRPLE